MSISVETGFSVDQPFTLLGTGGTPDTTTNPTFENGAPTSVRIVYPHPLLGNRFIRVDALGGSGSNIALNALGKRAAELVTVTAATDHSALSLGTPSAAYPTPADAIPPGTTF